MKRLFVFFALVGWMTAVMAQSLELKQPLEKVGMASVMVLYQNEFGKYNMPEKDVPFPFALIRVGLEGNSAEVSAAKSMLNLDLGRMYVVTEKYTDANNEIWFLVDVGVKNINLTCGDGCENLLLRGDGTKLRPDAVYYCKVHYVPDETIVIKKQKITSQYLVFSVEPKNAYLEVDGKMWPVDDGTAGNLLDFGTYSYRVTAPNYATQQGTVTINDPNNTQMIDIKLKPEFVQVTLTAENNAEIWVNGAKKGNGRWSGNLGYGAYRLETKLEGHIDGMMQLSLSENDNNKTFTLPTPTPIYGSLRVETQPFKSDIYIDGKAMGQTPKVLSEMIVGQHKVEVKKAGYETLTTTVTVAEGQTASVSGKLVQQVVQQTEQQQASSSSLSFTANGVTFEMIKVDGGTFTMGGTSEQGSDAESDEKPTHSVTLSDYYIGKYEVTQALWEAVLGNNPSNYKGSTKPVEMVSWDDCKNFISKLNSLLSSQLGGKRFALPTEAQWEFAARGGKKSQGYKYAGSNTIDNVAWYTVNSYDKGSNHPDYGTHTVGTKSPNELGLYDMSGNVWEWCQDWYSSSSYSSSSQTNPTGASSGSYRVFRGGSWLNYAGGCRVSFRARRTPSDRKYYLGFRVVLLP